MDFVRADRYPPSQPPGYPPPGHSTQPGQPAQPGYSTQRDYPAQSDYPMQSDYPAQPGYPTQQEYPPAGFGAPTQPPPYAPSRPPGYGQSPATQPARGNSAPVRRAAPIPVKIVIAGGFGVGKTTFVGAVSEIPPLTTEAVMTSLSVGIDDLSAVRQKTTTTVAMDFGRITVDDQLILYLFGTPGQSRFWFMWDDISRGSVGAVVLVDLRRIDDCFAPIDYFEDRRVPFVVAINNFAGADRFADSDVREALALRADCPLLRMDARDPRSCLATLITLVEHALARTTAA